MHERVYVTVSECARESVCGSAKFCKRLMCNYNLLAKIEVMQTLSLGSVMSEDLSIYQY